jgi:hypothetical protein
LDWFLRFSSGHIAVIEQTPLQKWYSSKCTLRRFLPLLRNGFRERERKTPHNTRYKKERC